MIYRHLTCPVCETVIRMLYVNVRGVETYVLPPHRPTLNVNLCTVARVAITLSLAERVPDRAELDMAPSSVPPEDDPRKCG